MSEEDRPEPSKPSERAEPSNRSGRVARMLTDDRALVRSDERAVLLFLLLLSVVALAVFLYYTTLVLEGLPDVLPVDPSSPSVDSALPSITGE